MFSDGIRPGGDLTDLDGSSERAMAAGASSSTSRRSRGSSSSSSSRRRGHSGKMSSKGTAEVGRSLIPPEEGRLPEIIVADGEEDVLDDLDGAIRDRGRKVAFKLNRNLSVIVCVVKCE